MRLQLYKAAALLVTDDYEAAVAQLTALDASKLGRNDLRLLENAQKLRRICAAVALARPARRTAAAVHAVQEKHGDVAAKSVALDTARSALAQAEQLLNREQK